MKIYTGADHRGFEVKTAVIRHLTAWGHTVEDQGTENGDEACDYPLIAERVARKVSADSGSRGILICMSGIGHSIAANKIPGVYAALCYNIEAAKLARQHNNSNVLVLGARFVPESDMPGLIRAWLETPFEEGRHRRRFDQIRAIEQKYFGRNVPAVERDG